MPPLRRPYDAPVPSACVQVTTATPSEDVADAIAAALLRRRLAACVQVVGPMRSRYWWHGSVETATEWQCVAKTTMDACTRAVDAIRAAHPYDVPEIVVTPIVDGDADYLAWILAEVRPAQ